MTQRQRKQPLAITPTKLSLARIRSRSLAMLVRRTKSLGDEKDGFLLSEAVLALFVTVLTILILQQITILSHKVMNLESYSNIRTHIVKDRLEELFDGKELTPLDKRLKISDTNKDGTQFQASLRLSNEVLNESINGGFEPIIANVKKFEVKRIRNSLLLTITLKNGTETEMFFSHVKFET